MRIAALSIIVLGAACSTAGKDQQGSPGSQASTAVAADTGSIPAGAFHLRYRIEGSGTPTIVIGSSIYYPRAFSPELRKSLRLVFLDTRGFAPAPDHPVDTTAFALDSLLDDVERTRQQLGLGRVAVIGHSGHSYLALEYAKKYPANVSHVIMVGIAPILSEAHARARDQYWADSASAERKAIMAENLRRLPDEELAKRPPGQGFIDGYVRNAPKIWYDPGFNAAPLWEGVTVNMDMMNHVWGRIFRDIDITQGLDRLPQPVLLLLGRFDFLLAPPSIWDPVRPKFKDLTVQIFEKSGHTPQYEEPALFDQVLLDWMRAHP